MKDFNLRGICAIFAPLSTGDSTANSATTTIASTLHLLEPLVKQVFAITGNFPHSAVTTNKVQIIDVKAISNLREPIPIRILRFIILQLEISYNLAKIASKIDVVFLAAGASTLFLPSLLAKLMRKRIIYLSPGTDALQRTTEVTYQKTLLGMGRRVFLPIVRVLERLNYYLADRVVVFQSALSLSVLEGRGNKVFLNGSRFYVDVTSFRVENDLGSRENIVGYVGRFEEIKGVMSFVKAIPLLSRKSMASFLIGGDGSLRGEIEKRIKDTELSERVTLTGWIPHDRLAQYLNRMKLLVIPSYTEVGPHLLFEAMACGTPVLATPVGVIPDVIKDGETGFIMENNSPECIAENIIRALKHPRFQEIAGNARALIEKEYTYEAAVERYRKILETLYHWDRSLAFARVTER